MLGQQDVGHRVVVRRFVGVRGERPLFTDLLGELLELTETDLTVATAAGPRRVPLNLVHRAKRVPPRRRPAAREVAALEWAADEAWPAPVTGRLGEWRLRSADGWTGRGNSALAVGDPGLPLPEAIDAVQRWYAERSQPALINAPMPLAAAVNAELDRRAWGTRPVTLVRTAPITGLAAGDHTVELRPEPSAEWLAIAAGRKGGFPAAARHLLTAVDQVTFAHVYADSGALTAVGRGTVTGDGRWLGLIMIEVVPEARRRGLAERVIRALATWAAARGATDAFLQVEERNTPAVTLYDKLGFTTHHRYLTRVAPPA